MPRAVSTTAKKAPARKAATKAPTGKTPARKTAAAKPVARESVKGMVEEMGVKADLAAMDVRDKAYTQLTAAENAWLAARKGLETAVADADRALRALVGAAGTVVADLRGAVEAADAAVRRSRKH